MKICDALHRFIGRECNVNVIEGEEITGILNEVGDGWILLTDDEDTEYIFNTETIIYIYAQ